MKKYFLMFGLTLVMGLFISNTVVAQWTPGTGVLWTNDNVAIGTSTPAAPFHVHMTTTGLSALQRMVRTGAPAAGITFDKANNGETAAGGTDNMGAFTGRLHNGTTYVARAAIRFQAGGTNTTGQILFQTHDGGAGGLGTRDRMVINKDGFVGIGTINPQSLLAVAGKITAQEVEVTMTGWADFVFADDYYLRPLTEVEQFINANRHLPDVPSEAEVLQNGVNVGEMSATLLQKIEELTLYIIDLNKRIAELEGK